VTARAPIGHLFLVRLAGDDATMLSVISVAPCKRRCLDEHRYVGVMQSAPFQAKALPLELVTDKRGRTLTPRADVSQGLARYIIIIIIIAQASCVMVLVHCSRRKTKSVVRACVRACVRVCVCACVRRWRSVTSARSVLVL